MNTARIRRAEKVMAALDPGTRADRYWDALVEENEHAERLVQTMPADQRRPFLRASLTIACVARHLPLAQNLLLRVQNHLLTGVVTCQRPMTDEAVDVWLDTTRAFWPELLAFEQFRKKATELTDGRSRPLAALRMILRETRRLLLDIQAAMVPELNGMETIEADPELAAILVGALPDAPGVTTGW